MDGKNRERLLLVSAAICIGAFLGDRLVLTPLVEFWDSRTEQIETLKQSLAKGELLLGRERVIQKRLREMERDSLPLNVSIASSQTLQAEDRWVNESQIKKISFKPQWKTYEDERYSTLECRAVYQGTMRAITRFLYEMETDSLPLKVESLEITSQDKTGDILTMTIVVSGMRFLPEEEAS